MATQELFKNVSFPVRPSMVEGYSAAWSQMAESGPFWTGNDRMAIIAEARQSLKCDLCLRRKQALSPNAISGRHDVLTDLPPHVVEVVHRIRSDPGRLTKKVLTDALAAGMTPYPYVELVGIVATSVIIDTMHQALGLEPPALMEGSTDAPIGQETPSVENGGAWLPISTSDGEVNELGIPRSANIIRAMGLVPKIVALFFSVMRQGYFIVGLPVDIERSQTEFIAARVSALNQCFY